MPKKLTMPEEFFEAFKLSKEGLSSKDIAEKMEKASYKPITDRTVRNWEEKYTAYEEQSGGELDEPWLWDKCEEYGKHGIPSNIEAIRRIMSHREAYIEQFDTKPSVREVKYIYLLFNIGENQWGVDDVVQKARRFAMGEFAVNAGGLGEDYVANIRKELDAEISQAIRNENNVTRRTR